MKIFCTLILTVIVAIVVERFRAEFLLVEVDDPALKARTATLDPSQCQWSAWSNGPCNVSCGKGKRWIKRIRVPKDGIEGICSQNMEDKKVDCMYAPCPVNCVWGEWKEGKCSTTCGIGHRIETREKTQIEKNGGICVGNSQQEFRCTHRDCPPERGVECCVVKGVTANCLGICEPEETTAKSILINTMGNCKKFEAIIKECTYGHDPCEPNPCTGLNAACREKKGEAECYCPAGTTGDPLIKCEHVKYPNCQKPCKPSGGQDECQTGTSSGFDVNGCLFEVCWGSGYCGPALK